MIANNRLTSDFMNSLPSVSSSYLILFSLHSLIIGKDKKREDEWMGYYFLSSSYGRVWYG